LGTSTHIFTEYVAPSFLIAPRHFNILLISTGTTALGAAKIIDSGVAAFAPALALLLLIILVGI
jgi:hypothetical protein